jgi:hypothetical protein
LKIRGNGEFGIEREERVKQQGQLSFSDYLRNLPPGLVFERLLGKADGSNRRILSSSLIDRAAEQFAAKPELSRRFDALGPEAQRACCFAYLFGRSGLLQHGFEHLHEQLVNSFLVYTALDTNNTRHYLGFDDLVGSLNETIGTTLAGDAVEQPKHCGDDGIHGPLQALNDFTALLILAMDQGLRLTRTGNLNRGTARELKKVLCAGGNRPAFESADADRHAFITQLIAYGVENGFLLERDQWYTTTPGRIGSWLAMSPAEQYDDLLGFCTLRLGGWRLETLEAICSAAAPRFLTMELFPPPARQMAMRMIRQLQYLGYVRAARHGDTVAWQVRKERLLETLEHAATATVLPDYSVLLGRDVLPATLYRFSLIGTLSGFDQIYHGTIDRQSVANALSRGTSETEMLDFLRQSRAPENVTATVREWIREFRRVYIATGSMIVSFEPNVSQQIRSYEPLKELTEALEAHQVFYVKPGQEEAVRKLLESMNLDPRSPWTTGQEQLPAERTGLAQEEEILEPVFDLTEPRQEEETVQIKSGKYSSELKQLELGDLLHVFDYAILMGSIVRFEYGGSPYVPQGMYRVRPLDINKGKESTIEAELIDTGRRKKFFIKRIGPIGVEQQ